MPLRREQTSAPMANALKRVYFPSFQRPGRSGTWIPNSPPVRSNKYNTLPVSNQKPLCKQQASEELSRLASSTPDATSSSSSSRHVASSETRLRSTSALLSSLLDPNFLPPPPSPSNVSSKASPRTPSPQTVTTNPLHPRVAVILGVDRRWYLPLLVCRALSIAPAAWWGLRCAFTFLTELLRIEPRLWNPEHDGVSGTGGWTAAIMKGTATVASVDWDVDRRFRVTEVALAIIWCFSSAYLSYFFADCMMSRWLLNYTPPAVVIRLLTTNSLLAYLTSWILHLSGASSDPRLLLPAWISITSILTLLYHLTQRKINIKKETAASLSVFSIASFISMCSLLLQLHLSRENEMEIPLFILGKKVWGIVAEKMVVVEHLRNGPPGV
ncbi:uncharacterized protein CIMG_00416 [Coccidioides immitis RS]|uniref:N-glycosylation protein EOS1 n=3 Tax=Coccidioides TaxID=5500 RepID=J3KGY9_COCIM|nr:uncharacterized protein CIMG_00416 [Coccidioides immitis RS]EAS35062.3 hypothetical protein CIMG_00416 [Coccidioides immitis RS]TPX26650.1 hypothetical protein DIZ76_012112 [Coccidioides immitis]